MPLASRGHVVIPVRPDFHCAPVFLCRHCGDGSKQVALRFLAAKAAAHAPHDHIDRVGWHTHHMADHVLHFTGMLCRGMDGHLIVLAGNGE